MDLGTVMFIHGCVRDEANKLMEEANRLPRGQYKDLLNEMADSYLRLSVRMLDIPELYEQLADQI